MEIYINGIGIISRCACSKEELIERCDGHYAPYRSLPLDFPIEIPSSRLRRNSRYNKIALAAADQALKDAHIPEKMENAGLDSHRIGTVVSTGYGAAEYSSVFADSVVKGDPNGCSPSVFSGSVPNSCLGQICIINHLKGFSTVLAGGDPLEYSSLLLKTSRADHILAGSVEEFFPDLYNAFGTIDAAHGSDLSEGAAMAVLSNEKSDESYCAITGFGSINLGKSPLIHEIADPEELTGVLHGVLQQFPEPDVVFSAQNGTWFDCAEEKAAAEAFGDIPVKKPKSLFGETL